MTYDEAVERAEVFGYTVVTTTPERNWFNATKTWGTNDQVISLQVYPDTENFVLTHYHGVIQVTTGGIGSFLNDVHFLRWQRQFMETIEKLV